MIVVNGERRSLPTPCPLGRLVDDLTSTRTGVAVALNGAVVPASQWDRLVHDGDVVDVLRAAQGG